MNEITLKMYTRMIRMSIFVINLYTCMLRLQMCNEKFALVIKANTILIGA